MEKAIFSIAMHFTLFYWKKVLALVGITDMNARRRTQPEYPVTAILSHEGFNYITMENNIALLKTYTAIEFNDQVQPICFPSRNLAPGILENCWVSGWIHTAATRKRMEMGVLRKLPVQEVWPCSLKRPRGTACYSSKEEDNTFGCLGDPGNPVLCQAKENSLWLLSGILNKGGVSCTGPFLSTKLSYYGDWISKRIMKEWADLCPTFQWQELPSTLSPIVRSKLQNMTWGRPSQAFSFPPLPPRREGRLKMQKGRARLKPAPAKAAPSLKERQDSGRPQIGFQETEVGRAGLDSTEPIYYDYYNGEVMPISGQGGLCRPWEMIPVFSVLALVFGDI
ncbi:inactive serine protease 54 [Dromiciops gliroides]|uniref:inactive serine protease 54 n=1 Tax=Dromiciops gliroides TaxID=33562 RepID=UPI001CC72EE9|nr:inactive serine protease 54 [Dromiciops gliroides]